MIGDEVVGELGLGPEQMEDIRRRLRSDKSGVLESSEGALFARCYAQAPRMVIVGASITQALAPMAAMAGFEVVVVDPRRAFATAERLPGVTVTTEWPDEALARIGLDAQTAVVTLSHDPKLDDPALIAALQSPCFYIGALGSSRTHAKRVARLTEAGLAAALPRIHAPVGLDLGGRSPAEIAVSVLAQGPAGKIPHMIFGEFRCEEAEGVMLAHTLNLGEKTLKKGRVLTAADVALLKQAGFDAVTGARMEAGDLDENAGAAEIAALLVGPNMEARRPYHRPLQRACRDTRRAAGWTPRASMR
ncbi:MAG: XdhC family protein [Rhodocyclaceae bacterium]|nr:XdhC family protein [Rhodocyclaceae bacterium]